MYDNRYRYVIPILWLISDSDSDILETVEKADLVEFLLIIRWVWKRFIYMGNLQIASVYNFWRETAERNFGFFTMPNKQISPEISSLFSLPVVKKPKFLSAVSNQILYTDDT